MWILTGNEKSPDMTHYLPCNRDILVGRRTDIRLEGDKSISRTHACLHATYQPEDVLSPTCRGQVTLSDRSKYGTSVNGQRVEADTTVADGDVITFGLQWNTWTLSWRPLSVTTSLVSHPERDALKTVLAELGGTLLTDWGPTVDYLMMSSFKMSVKAVLALASGTPVVTPQYVREMASCVQAGVAPNVRAADFEPALDEPTLVGSGCTIGVDRARSTLLFGKRFVFAEERQLRRMRQAVELAGGTALLLATCGLSPPELTETDVIVMHTELKSPEVNKLKALLKRARRRLVKDEEIGLAILKTSTERDCNPAFDYRSNFVPPLASTQSQSLIGTVLARETQAAEVPSCGVPPPPAAAGRQTRRTVSPTPPTPSGAVTEPTAGPSSPTASGRCGSRPAEPDWSAGSAEKRPRLQAAAAAGPVPPSLELLGGTPAAATAGPVPPSLELLGGTPAATTAGRRCREAPAEEPRPALKRPRLAAESAVSRPAPAPVDDLFDFELEQGSRPQPQSRTKIKREPPPVLETPPCRGPPAGPWHPAVKPDPDPEREGDAGDAGVWISSCRPTQQPLPPPAGPEQHINKREQVEGPQQELIKREQVPEGGDGDTTALVRSCIRLQISALICPRRPPADTAAAAGPNYKRFRRVRQAPVCPRIIGGSDLFVGYRRSAVQTSIGNGAHTATDNGRPASDEDDLGLATGRPEDEDEEMLRMLEGIGRDRSRASRRR